jgi:hypothetical protein
MEDAAQLGDASVPLPLYCVFLLEFCAVDALLTLAPLICEHKL